MSEIINPCGVLVVDKAPGMTSHDVVSRVRRLYSTRAVGHTGTLDPMATGVLTVLVGRATKAADYLASDDKGYTATLKLGITTDTCDTTGKIIGSSDTLPTAQAVKSAAKNFLGNIRQIPPMYSALKVGGKKLYELARGGIEIEREAREITISRLEVEVIDEAAGDYRLSIECSKGTYIRSLCHDIGEALGCGGAMSSLRRTRAGIFTLKDAHTLGELEERDEAGRALTLVPLEEVFSPLPELRLPDFYARLARNGQALYSKKVGADYGEGTLLRLADKDGFFAVGRVVTHEGEARIKVDKLFF